MTFSFGIRLKFVSTPWTPPFRATRLVALQQGIQQPIRLHYFSWMVEFFLGDSLADSSVQPPRVVVPPQ